MNQLSTLNTATFSDLKDRTVDIAILPWGATEPHGYHLPYGTDTLQADSFARQAANLAVEMGVMPMVLPPIPFGVQNEGQRQLVGCISLRPTTQLALLEDVIVSLISQHIMRLVLLNSHGGNDFRFAIRELQMKYPAFLIVTVDWWKHPSIPKIVTNPGDHAGGVETSVMMHLHPTLVKPLTEAGDGRTTSFCIDALNQGWAWTPRNWSRVSVDTGIGNPHGADARQGREVFEVVSRSIADLVVALVREADMYNPL